MFTMHEMSLMSSIWDSILVEKERSFFDKLLTVELEIGEFLGVVDDAMQLAFEAFKMDYSWADSASLQISQISSEVQCNVCSQKWLFKEHWYFCPHCGVSNTKIISGKDIHIISIEVEK